MRSNMLGGLQAVACGQSCQSAASSYLSSMIEDGTEPNRWVRPARATQRRRRKEDTMKRSRSRSDAENGRVVANGVSRRELIAAGGAMAAVATSSPLIANTASAQGSAGADAILDRL